MTPRYFAWLTVVAVALASILVGSADAQRRDRDRDRDRDRGRDRPKEGCKDDIINAAGRAKFRPFTRQREIEGRGASMADAVANWQRDVSAKYGSQWMLWENADKIDEKCAPARPGTIGGFFIRCTLSAKPCGGGPVTDEGEGEPPSPARICEDYPMHRLREVQRLLNCYCRTSVPVDGLCGPTTTRCTRDFQNSRFGRERRLRTDGLPHRETRDALREYCEVGRGDRDRR